MDEARFKALEVRPEKFEGWFKVCLWQFKKQREEDAEYFEEWLEYKNGGWDYSEYKGTCMVCFILKREDANSK